MASPNAYEQEMLELINRARADPAGEFDKIVINQGAGTGADADITNALAGFSVDLALFKAQLAAFNAVAPLAWNDALNIAAVNHTNFMIAQDAQEHVLPGEDGLGVRFTGAGYIWNNIGENIFAYSKSAEYGHAGFVVDWGGSAATGGMQDPAGHRNSILSAVYTEIGIGAVAESNSATAVGPMVVTQDFGFNSNYKAQVVGVVFKDGDADNFYDAGEGLGGVTVTITGTNGTFTTQTWGAGGYQLEVAAGNYTVTFSGGGYVGSKTENITIGASNVKVDALSGDAPQPVNDIVPLFTANADIAKGLAAAYEFLLGGVPNEGGFIFLINSALATNFGSNSSTVFNVENIYINLINNLAQNNPEATANFNAIFSGLGAGATLAQKVTVLYQTQVPADKQSAEGLAFLTRPEALTFYEQVAGERGVTGPHAGAIIAAASLINIVVGSDFGLGDNVNDLYEAVKAGSAALPASGNTLTPINTADGTAFDGDDVASGSNSVSATPFLFAEDSVQPSASFNYDYTGDASNDDLASVVGYVDSGDVWFG